MCGGIGSRFWPYSRSGMPKQFIDFFGTGRSLLQMTYDRITPLVPRENILVVTAVIPISCASSCLILILHAYFLNPIAGTRLPA